MTIASMIWLIISLLIVLMAVVMFLKNNIVKLITAIAIAIAQMICWVVVFSWILRTLDNKLREALASMTNGEIACGVVITVAIYAATYIIGNTIWNRCKNQKEEK